MAFTGQPYPIGFYTAISGTSNNDDLTGYGLQAIFAGPGNDRLTGYAQPTGNGRWQLIPILAGGIGNDSYLLRAGSWTIIADLGGGKDTIITTAKLAEIAFARINGRDLLATDGATTALIIDPLGIEGGRNKIERVIFGGKKFSAKKLYNMALKSNNYLGDYSYADLQSGGILNLSEAGLNPFDINEYISLGLANNSLVA